MILGILTIVLLCGLSSWKIGQRDGYMIGVEETLLSLEEAGLIEIQEVDESDDT